MRHMGLHLKTIYAIHAKSQTRLSNFTFTFHFPALEKAMATHSSVLAWRIPGTGEPGGLPSIGPHRVGHNWSNLAAAAAACNPHVYTSLQVNMKLLEIPFISWFQLQNGSHQIFPFTSTPSSFPTLLFKVTCECEKVNSLKSHTTQLSWLWGNVFFQYKNFLLSLSYSQTLVIETVGAPVLNKMR